MRVGLVRVLDDWDKNTERDTLVHVLLPTLRMQVDSGFRDADAADAKIGGSLALAFAAIGLLITIHNSLNSLWVIPAAVLGLAVVCLLDGIRARAFHVGPLGDVFYAESRAGRRTTLAAADQMAGDLIEAFYINLEQNSRKMKSFKRGFALLLVGLLGCVLVAAFRNSPSKGGVDHGTKTTRINQDVGFHVSAVGQANLPGNQ